MSDPSVVNAIAPTTAPPFVFHDTTGFASLSRSMPHTASGAPPHLPDVAAYSVVFTPIGDDHFAFGGRNSAGRWMSLPDARPTTCSTPSLAITYATPDGRARKPKPPDSGAGGAPGIRSAGG